MYYNRKKELLKSGLIITFILLIAVASTYYIYNKYKKEYNVDYNSKSLEIVFHERSGDQVALTKVTPLTDSVGLSTKAYTFTIKNNLTESVKYKVKLTDDIIATAEDDCGEYQIPKETIKVAVKSDKLNNVIYNLNELEDGLLISDKIKALGEEDFTIRVWVGRNSSVPNGTTLHYHAKIQVIEKDNIVAIR